MQKDEDIDALYEKYKNFDFSQAKPVSEVPALAKIQRARREQLANERREQLTFLDDDVVQWLYQFDETKRRMILNDVIRSNINRTR